MVDNDSIPGRQKEKMRLKMSKKINKRKDKQNKK
jgi:hypothetical protein